MNSDDTDESFSGKLRKECEPLVIHVGVIVVLVLGLVVISLMVELLRKINPHSSTYCDIIEQVDAWAAATLVLMFALYTLLLVGILLFKNIKLAVSEKKYQKVEQIGAIPLAQKE